jgi:ribosomal protein L32
MQKARQIDYTSQRDLAQPATAVCGTCGAKTQGGKFCPECGTAISAKRTCANCGTQSEGTPKFCPECGESYG